MPSVATTPRGPGLISAPRRAEDGLPDFGFVPAHARHHCALSLSATEAPSLPATFIRCPDPTLPPQAPPSPRAAHRPHHRRPQPLPHAPVARSFGILRLVQKEKLFLMFQAIDLQYLDKFRRQEGHHFRFQSLHV
jgi:hypothetical protein